MAYMRFSGKRLKEAMDLKGASARTLARQARAYGVALHPQSVSVHISETSVPKADTAYFYAKILRVPIESLFVGQFKKEEGHDE